MVDVLDVSPTALAKLLLSLIETDRPRLQKIDRYVEGKHDGPYMPPDADAEYRKLAERSITNVMPLLLATPAQALYVDSFRRGRPSTEGDSARLTDLPEWEHWQYSRLDARQLPIHRGALKYGHAFTITELDDKGKVVTKGLSALNTAAVYEDSANDVDPFAALTITAMPDPNAKRRSARLGRARMWDGTDEYAVTFQATADLDSVRVTLVGPHGLNECPVTRFAASLDLEGRTVGVVEPHIAIQDRISQTVFDLLVTQTYGAFRPTFVAGMAPPMRRWTQPMIDGTVSIGIPVPEGTEVGDPIIDPDSGKPIPEGVSLNARRWLFFEDEKVKAERLEATTLDGYLKSLETALRHLGVVTQTPPHYLLGEIANLSAEALQAAETSLLRRVEEFRKSFGESWERVFRIAGELSGNAGSAQDYAGEVIWRDTAMRSMAAVADALVKLRELGIPKLGLWSRVPEATRGEIEEWMRLREQEMAEVEARAQTLEENIAEQEQVTNRLQELR